MRVLLTGGTGNVGRAAVDLLVRDGLELTVIGRRPGVEVPGAAYRQIDVNDFDPLVEAMRGFDAVVHLAAHGSPFARPGREIFRVNDLGTFNVYEAAAECGVGRVVSASSINALGSFFGEKRLPIEYLPVDEEHPTLATDAYSFSKQVMERIGEYFWQRDGISSVMLRLPAVVTHERILQGDDHYEAYDETLVAGLLAMSADDRRRELERLHREYDALRRRNRADRGPLRGWWREPDDETALSRDELHFMHHKVNFFTYVDELDSARAIALGLSADYEGSHPLFINARANSLGLPLEQVALLFEPDRPELRSSAPGDTTIVSIDRAREVIGFEPEWEIYQRLEQGGPVR